MKNQKMILLLAGLTAGIIIVLFVVDFILPKGHSVRSMGLLGRRRTSLFGTKTSGSGGPFQTEQRNSDRIDSLGKKLDLVAGKLDKAIEMVEALESFWNIKPTGIQKTGEFTAASEADERISSSKDSKPGRYGSPLAKESPSVKLLTPFAQLSHSNRKREQEISGLTIGSAGRDNVPLSKSKKDPLSHLGGYQRGLTLGNENEAETMQGNSSTNPRSIPALNPSKALENISRHKSIDSSKVGNKKQSSPPKELSAGSVQTNGSEQSPGLETGSESRDKSKEIPITDNFEKFIGELLGDKFEDIRETTPLIDIGKKKPGLEGNKALSLRSFEFSVPPEVRVKNSSEMDITPIGAEETPKVRSLDVPLDKETPIDAKNNDITNDKKDSSPNLMNLSKNKEYAGSTKSLSEPPGPPKSFSNAKGMSFPHKDSHKLGTGKDVGKSISEQKTQDLKGRSFPIKTSDSYLDDSDTSFDGIGSHDSTEDYSSEGDIKFLSVAEGKQMFKRPLSQNLK